MGILSNKNRFHLLGILTLTHTAASSNIKYNFMQDYSDQVIQQNQVSYRFLGFTSQPSRHFTKVNESPGEISVFAGSWAQNVNLCQQKKKKKILVNVCQEKEILRCLSLLLSLLTSSAFPQLSHESAGLPAEVLEAWCSRPRTSF